MRDALDPGHEECKLNLFMFWPKPGLVGGFKPKNMNHGSVGMIPPLGLICTNILQYPVPSYPMTDPYVWYRY